MAGTREEVLARAERIDPPATDPPPPRRAPGRRRPRAAALRGPAGRQARRVQPVPPGDGTIELPPHRDRPGLRGQGLGSKLAAGGPRRRHRPRARVIVRCPFISAYVRRHRVRLPRHRAGTGARTRPLTREPAGHPALVPRISRGRRPLPVPQCPRPPAADIQEDGTMPRRALALRREHRTPARGRHARRSPQCQRRQPLRPARPAIGHRLAARHRSRERLGHRRQLDVALVGLRQRHRASRRSTTATPAPSSGSS